MAKRKPEHAAVPTYRDMVNPIFISIKNLGNLANVYDIHDSVIQLMDLKEDALSPMHNGKNESEFYYRLKWVLTYMKNAGIIDVPKRGTRCIVSEYINQELLTESEIDLVLRSTHATDSSSDHTHTVESTTISDVLNSDPDMEPWRTELKELLYRMDPYKFEVFCKDLLEACDIHDVVLTQKSRDGWVDGYGRLVINEIFSIKVVFQCKRYAPDNPISSKAINEFRGAFMHGDAEMGLFITTSHFTKDARDTAKNSYAKEIHLMDIEDIVQKLIDHRIGVIDKTVFIVDTSCFDQYM